MDAGTIKKNGGYTLVEVMVAMAISLIVLAGVYKAIVDESVNFEKDEAVLDMQNNARVAIARIARDIRRTGFFGCGGELSANTVAGFSFPPTSIVFAGDDSTNSAIDDGTDSITLQFLAGDVPVDVDTPTTLPSATDPITLYRKAFNNGDTLYVTDCEEYAIFDKTNGTEPSKTVEHGVNLGRAYGTPLPARVYRFETAVYRVNGAQLRDINGQVIANNIEDLQFEFITDSDDDGELNDENWANTFTNAADVRAIRIWVLAMSDTAYSYTDTNTYDYPNSPYHSGTAPYNTNGTGGSPASQTGLSADLKHRYRYLASTIVYLRNAAIV